MDTIPIHVRIGHNLQSIRKQMGLSLDKAAGLTNVSKGTLHQIERGDLQPTVTTVWKIATGLNISFSSLLKDDDAAVTIAARKDVPDVTEDNGTCRVYVLFPFDPQTRIETFTMEVDPGGRYTSSPHRTGVREYIAVVSGVFRIEVNGEAYTLGAMQAIRFAGSVPHSYMNESDRLAVLHITMHYADVY
ncbi:helix-turn-helix domain-containing protein [Paenibacillus ginsengarvi]|uniref:XRE family transcriptional regulator n=1 Tax=Paenibacillus ginsengarvi TaxID=400777 RepID=A0A3B0CPE1_9BACL|nr:XRE family transcriptional regulator [Paenibacillus ginsengarvi]RKN86842.1 XRE family transcriptional regulator [Paenibacillus ginsengarvi]